MLAKKILDLEEERQETREFIELLKSVPREKRRDIKFIMIGVSLMNQEYEERKGA